MLTGKDLRHKGHTLECWFNSIEPNPIIYKTDKPETIVFMDGKVWHKPCNKKPIDFETIEVDNSLNYK